MTAPLLEISDLHLRFRLFEGTSHVLNGLNLHVAAGEKVAIVGESGCGKSVLLRAILGLLDRANCRVDGRIRFNNRDLEPDDAVLRRELLGRRLTMIFQDPASALNPVFTIGDQMTEVIRRERDDVKTADALDLAREALRQVAITAPDRVLRSYPFQLSGGMSQRAMIAMALINRPDLVLADEPGTALDVRVQAQTLQLMRDRATESGTAILLITHNLGVVREFADRVYVMYAGMMVEHATTAQLFDAPKHPYTRALLAAVPPLTGETQPVPIDGMVPDFTTPPPGCRFHPRCAHAEARCRERPPLVGVAPGHDVACVLWSAVGSAPP